MAISGGDGSIILTTKVDEGGLSKGLSRLKSGVGAFGKAFAVAGAAGVAAFASITKAAVDSYAEYEQLAGGVETLFKDSAKTLMKYADEAYKTAGMSANEYMAGVTSFSASMIASVGGDTAKAAELSNQAMIAISDNANKMGTDMEMIVQTYQSLARGNVMMLDNLKLGYGGTKQELERLIADAEEYKRSMGEIVDYDASNFADVTQAIQAIQEKLGIAGATAQEASTTIQGSAMAMKAAWQNLLTGMADPTQDFDALLQNFISSIGTFAGNLLPVVQTAAQGVLQMVEGLLPQIPAFIEKLLPVVMDGIVGVVSGIANVFPQLINTIATQLPTLMQTIVSALPSIIQSIVSVLPTLIPQLVGGISQAVTLLANNASNIIQPLIAALPDILIAIVDAIMTNLPLVIEGTISLVMAIVEAIPEIIDGIVQALPTIISLIISGLLKCLPQIISGLIQVVWGIVKSLPSIFVSLIEGIGNIFVGIWDGIKDVFASIGDWFGEKFSEAWEAIQDAWSSVVDWFSGIWDSISAIFEPIVSWFSDKFGEAWDGIKNIWSTVSSWFSSIWSSISGVFSSVGTWFSTKFGEAVSGIKTTWANIKAFFVEKWNSITSVFSDAKNKFLSIGSNIVAGIKQGISNAWNNLKEWFRGLFGDLIGIAKNILGIKSPSRVFRDEVGKMIPAGVAVGIDEARNLVTDSVVNMLGDSRSEVQKVLDEMNEETLDSEKFYAEESLRIEREREEAEYQERLKAAKTAEERKKIEDERAKKLQERADEEYLNGLRETAEKERRLYEARQKDIQNYQESIVEAYQDAAEEILDSIEDLQKRQESLASKLSDYGSVMEDVVEIEDRFSDVHSPLTQRSDKYFVANLDNQTRELERYYHVMSNLRQREGMSTELFDIIKNMSFEESFEYSKRLMSMSDAQFSEYIKDWEKKQETSKKISEDLFGDDGKMTAQSVLSDLTDQTNTLKDYYSLLEQVKGRAELPEGFFDTLRDMGVEEGLEYANALLELSDEDFANYIQAWEEKQKTSQDISKALYQDEAEQLATEIGDKFEEVEKEFFSVGEDSAIEFESGFLEQLNNVVTNIKGAIGGAFANIGIGITPTYGTGNYSINVPALARGSVLPGGNPFLAIVNDQPRGQTNVEAPLQTIVDAMNIALNNRGGGNVVREEHYNLNETELMTIIYKLAKNGERLRGSSLISGGAY